ncbi:hypothetical protein O152_gp286 [Pseudomonas phage PaBG]|uniref:Uncharacterized protein n=1 Tax=Pseudomonas phage PaBG TaxID=1335230 RepID=S5VZN6_9CAUD|nr:hypothetical protein O152_gp286 [Pseudomonas phage PaBG]AGS82075.1 hypothetical protein PaBG_00200 [Pseudomonas phage PaBG]
MKLRIVTNVEFPRDVSEDYRPVWDAFLKMRAVTQLRMFENAETAVPECFRLLINQTGAKVKLLHTVKECMPLAKPIKRLKDFLRKGDVLGHMRIVRHSQSMRYQEAGSVCALYNPVFQGIVVLRPMRFDLNYMVNRMQGLLFKHVPYQISDKMPNGNPKKQKKFGALRDADYATVLSTTDLVVYMARTENELVLKYEVKLAAIVPLYQRVDVALKSTWRNAITGVFV